MNAILLVIDRLHAGYLGAYGNGWIATPAIDRLAAEGFVFDQCLIDSPQVGDPLPRLVAGKPRPDAIHGHRPKVDRRRGGPHRPTVGRPGRRLDADD